ncbi:MAG: 4Fe-4S dicluster domain-containing protein [Spirochaetota bacterium]
MAKKQSTKSPKQTDEVLRSAVDDNESSDEAYSLTPIDRKRAITLIGSAIGLGVMSTVISRIIPNPAVPKGPITTHKIPPVQDGAGEVDILVRMQNELRRALFKPMEERRWLMVIDTRKCVGCHACTVACIAENKLPPGVVYRPVITEHIGQYPHQITRFFPRPCMQCNNPSCVSVCPVRATWKRPDGVVIIDYDRCIGCRYCLTACPYGARTSDFGNYYTEHTPEIQPYEKQPSNEYNKSWSREGHGSPVGNARKCHFCLHRIEQGLLPQCVSTCIGRANYFGDANDARSLVAEMAKSSNQMKLLEEKGTKPEVIYLV